MQLLFCWNVYAANVDDWKVKDYKIKKTSEGIRVEALSLADGYIVYIKPVGVDSFSMEFSIRKVAGYNPNIDHWINFSLLNKPEYFLGSDAQGFVVLIRPLSESKTKFEFLSNPALKMIVAKELDIPPVADLKISLKKNETEWIFSVNGVDIPIDYEDMDSFVLGDGNKYLSMCTSGNGDPVEFVIQSINGESLGEEGTTQGLTSIRQNETNFSNFDQDQVKSISRFGIYHFVLAGIVLSFGISGIILITGKSK